MRVSDVKHASERYEVRDLTSLDIQSYGEDNAYPQRIHSITSASPTAKICIDRFAKFIRGRGFSDATLYKLKVNRWGLRSDRLLRLVSDDFARYGGFCIHLNYNVLGEIVGMQHIPFEHARLGLEDDSGYVGNIAINRYWVGKHKKKAKPENTDYIDIYNPKPEVIQAQIVAAGGIELYKGQVLYLSNEGENTYPIPVYDSAITEISTDEGLANVKYRNVRNNFLPGGILITRKGTTVTDEKKDFDKGFDAQGFKQFQGDTNAVKIIHVELEYGEEEPEFKEFPSHSYDRDFEVTETSTQERIYAVLGQEAFYRTRTGALGWSAEVVSEAFTYYNSYTQDERLLLEEVFNDLFSHWHQPVTPNFQILPLSYDGNMDIKAIPPEVYGVMTDNEKRALVGLPEIKDAESDETLLAEKIGVGGRTGNGINYCRYNANASAKTGRS